MIKIYLYIGGLALFILAVSFLEVKFKSEKSSTLSFKKKQYFFSIPERKFYEVLKEVANELNYELFAKVRWADIVYSDNKGKEWMSNWGRIKSKHVDFLLCNKADYSPMIAVELDDSSHLRKDRVKRDSLQTEVMKLAGLKLVRFGPQAMYTKEEVKEELLRTV